MRKFDLKVKLEVVRGIMQGELLLKEAMEKYDIKSKVSIVRWIQKYGDRVKSG